MLETPPNQYAVPPHHYNSQIVQLIQQKMYPLRLKHIPSTKLPSIRQQSTHPSLSPKYVQVTVSEPSAQQHTELEEEHRQRKKMKSSQKTNSVSLHQFTSRQSSPLTTDIAKLKNCQSLLSLNSIITRKEDVSSDEAAQHEEDGESESGQPSLIREKKQHQLKIARINDEIDSKKKKYMKKVKSREEFSHEIEQNRYSLEYLVEHLKTSADTATPSIPFQNLSPNRLHQFIRHFQQEKQSRRSHYDCILPDILKKKRQREDGGVNSMLLQREDDILNYNALSAKLRLKANHRKMIVLGRSPQ